MVTIAILSILLLAVIGGIVLSYIPHILIAIMVASVILLHKFPPFIIKLYHIFTP